MHGNKGKMEKACNLVFWPLSLINWVTYHLFSMEVDHFVLVLVPYLPSVASSICFEYQINTASISELSTNFITFVLKTKCFQIIMLRLHQNCIFPIVIKEMWLMVLAGVFVNTKSQKYQILHSNLYLILIALAIQVKIGVLKGNVV